MPYSKANSDRFPLYHRQTLLHQLNDVAYFEEQHTFAEMMAICAVASARVRDGAVLPVMDEPNRLNTPTAEAFVAIANDVMPDDPGSMKGLSWMRACAMLALYGIQVGDTDMMHHYLGTYHAMVAMGGLHDEKNWPKNIGIVEVEERRRLVSSRHLIASY
jgi:hypothetical protein